MKSLVRRLLHFALALSLLSACSGKESPSHLRARSSRPGIMGGELVDLKTDELALVTAKIHAISSPRTSEDCTAVLVGEQILLTSAHCVAGFEKKQLKFLSSELRKNMRDPRVATFIFENTPLIITQISALPNAVIDAVEVAIPPQYTLTVTNQTQRADIALIKLASAPLAGISHPQLKIDFAGIVNSGDRVLSYGYGVSKISKDEKGNAVWESDYKLRRKEFVVFDSSRFSNSAAFNDSYMSQSLPGAPAGVLCGGDSGGPMIKKTSAGSVIVGIQSRSERECLKFNVATSTAAYREWIQKQVSDWGLSLY